MFEAVGNIIVQHFKKEFYIITACVVSLTALILVKFIFMPVYSKMAVIDEKIENLKVMNIGMKSLDMKKQKIRQLKDYFPSDAEQLWVLNAAVDLAHKSGIDLKQVDPIEPQRYDSFSLVKVKLSARCSYHDLGRFISDIENSKYFFKVEKLDFKSIKVPGVNDNAETPEQNEPNAFLTLCTLVLPSDVYK